MLINISGGRDLTLHEVAEAARIISDAVDPDANIISGMVIDERMEDEMKVTVIATGFRYQGSERVAAMPQPARGLDMPLRPAAPATPAMMMAEGRDSRAEPREEPGVADIPFYRKAVAQPARRGPGRLRAELVERRRLRHPDRLEEADGLSGLGVAPCARASPAADGLWAARPRAAARRSRSGCFAAARFPPAAASAGGGGAGAHRRSSQVGLGVFPHPH